GVQTCALPIYLQLQKAAAQPQRLLRAASSDFLLLAHVDQDSAFGLHRERLARLHLRDLLAQRRQAAIATPRRPARHRRDDSDDVAALDRRLQPLPAVDVVAADEDVD